MYTYIAIAFFSVDITNAVGYMYNFAIFDTRGNVDSCRVAFFANVASCALQGFKETDIYLMYACFV